MKGKRRSIEEKVRILRKADGEMTVLQVAASVAQKSRHCGHGFPPEYPAIDSLNRIGPFAQLAKGALRQASEYSMNSWRQRVINVVNETMPMS